MEELLPSASFLLPSFRCYLSSPLMYAYSTFSGKYLNVALPLRVFAMHQIPVCGQFSLKYRRRQPSVGTIAGKAGRRST
jgi:hypothetical protein